MNDFYEGLDNNKKLSIIAGPCVFENSSLAVDIATSLSEILTAVGVPVPFFIFRTLATKPSQV